MQTTVGATRILIYGDSITFARIPGELTRFNEQTRWPGVMQQLLGRGYEVIAEGLRARMLRGENPYIGYRDGYEQFGPILASHLPLDLLVILLGSNDACNGANKSPLDIAHDLRDYFPLLRDWCEQQHMPVPKVLIVAPPAIVEENLKGEVYRGAEVIIRDLPELYAAVARENEALFFNAAAIVAGSKEDGVHLDATDNKLLGRELAEFIAQACPSYAGIGLTESSVSHEGKLGSA